MMIEHKVRGNMGMKYVLNITWHYTILMQTFDSLGSLFIPSLNNLRSGRDQTPGV